MKPPIMDREITKHDYSLLNALAIGMILWSLIILIFAVSTGITNASDNSTSTIEIVKKEKTVYEVIDDQARKIVEQDILISKYAQKNDYLRLTCNQ